MMQELLYASPSLMNFAYFFLLAVLMLFFVLGFVTYVILAERKVMGFIQLRKGPNQVGGSWGLLQTVADVLKLLIKEDIIPKLADRPLYKLAPIIAFAPSFMVIAVIPF
ncbi:MAG TPA: NADH-quinone oxidoreductase subunit H, partial [Bacillus sp. (in: firmicutes)]|nr:NADH-quinone oxidoreductase subunit H [Bacillus sp. (in: firmicutes)]